MIRTYQVYRLRYPYEADFEHTFINQVALWVDEFQAENNEDVLVQATRTKPFVAYRPEQDVIVKGGRQIDLTKFVCGDRLAPVHRNMSRIRWYSVLV